MGTLKEQAEVEPDIDLNRVRSGALVGRFHMALIEAAA
jgi:hypothetical protein